MGDINWIMSDGGPLICMERRVATLWGGTQALTVAAGDARTDYDRACAVTGYLESVALRDGFALIVGDAPLDTAFWRSAAGPTFIVRIWYCEQTFDVDAVMNVIDARIFDKPAERLRFSFSSSDLIMFDSAAQLSETDTNAASFSIEPGSYDVLTQPYQPDALTSLVLHRFDPAP